jgi:leader peptidase (prepilin peptidase)/N-methyltransferase
VIFLAVVAVFFGLVVGSFLNVVIHRVPLRQSIVWPSSQCPKCGAPIKSFDNIPLLSYLLLRGKCRECRARISPRYPLVEGLTGLLFGLAAYEFGFSLALVPALVFVAVLIVLAVTDLEHRLLPNAIVLPATIVGLVLSIAVDPERWWGYVVSTVAVAAGLFALVFAYPRGMGMGDVKMGGMLGAFLGPYAALAVFIGALVGALVGGALMAAGKMGRRTALPFGVFLAVAGVLVLFVGEDIWGAYARLIGVV